MAPGLFDVRSGGTAGVATTTRVLDSPFQRMLEMRSI
jgi:hypothetical protein